MFRYRCFLMIILALLIGLPTFAEPEKPVRIADNSSTMPAIHGPRIVGATPGRPFLFLIPATGIGPLTFSAVGLPEGLSLDPQTGIISGTVQKPGRRVVVLSVRGEEGSSTRKLVIIAGRHKLALTPPMGWSSWNLWADAVDEDKVREAADWMVKSGLAAHGYQFINVDDTWENTRDGSGEIRYNWKFNDMKSLGDYIHSKGLKFGIYSSPARLTSQGYQGSYGHEEQDARSFAKWGVDYLKYDWSSSFGSIAPDGDLQELQEPFRIMRKALDKCDRDVVYSISQHGLDDVWEWGQDVGANLWRITRDLRDSWAVVQRNGFSQDNTAEFAQPGHWNDLDMLVVGTVGWGPNHHPCRLSEDEQITHMTLWSLLASPLILGCDLSQLDQFTLNLLTNDEVIDVDQDPLGKAARLKSKEDETEVWARKLWDGTWAVGLFNRGPEPDYVSVKWSRLDLDGSQPVRDLWRKMDLGESRHFFRIQVPSHGAVLVKIGKPKRTDW